VNSGGLKRLSIKEKIYRYIFWAGYIMVIIAAFIPFKKDLHKITLNVVSFKFHLDQVLHTIVYFLICIYSLVGQLFGVTLFKENSFRKFILAVFILATITEAVQLFVPYRAFNFFDWLSNVIGMCIGIGVIWGVGRLRKVSSD
jgi:VanZ family protein